MYFEQGEVITRMRRKRATEFVTSDEIMLREFNGAILLFRNENQHFLVFLIKIILIFFFITLSINPNALGLDNGVSG